jgi:hypothetical protein
VNAQAIPENSASRLPAAGSGAVTRAGSASTKNIASPAATPATTQTSRLRNLSWSSSGLIRIK